MNTTTEENGIVTTRNENGDIIGQHNSRICLSGLEVGINDGGGVVSSAMTSIASGPMVSGLSISGGNMVNSSPPNPNVGALVNTVVIEKPLGNIGGDTDIPICVGVAGKSLHVGVNLGDDLLGSIAHNRDDVGNGIFSANAVITESQPENHL